MPQTQRYFLQLSYDGTRYHGWQSQPNAVGVQQLINEALSTVLRAPIETTGCGRTDTGVHAREFFAHFDMMENGEGTMEDVKEKPSSIVHHSSSIIRSLNALLPHDIAIKRIIPVAADAHARFDATLRSYQYHIHFEKDPFLNSFSWQLRDKPDVALMNQAAAIINSKELGKIRHIERIIGKKFTKAEIPNGFDVCEKQLFAIVHKVHKVEVNEQQIEQYLPRIMDEFKDLDKEEVIKRFASIEFNRFLDYYKNAPDLNAPADDRAFREGERGERSMRPAGGKSEFTRLFINLGSVDDLNRGDLLNYICNTAKISGRIVGKIDVKGVFSFFEIPNEESDKVMAGFNGAEFNGRPVRVEVSGEGTSERREGGNRDFKRREGGYGGGGRREGGYNGGGNREGGYNRDRREGSNAGGGFRDFSGKRREDRNTGNSGDRRRRF